MAHWAELNDENTVIRVLVGDNEADDEGISWIEENLGGNWVKTSYNANFGGKFAGIGDYYDADKKEFFSVPGEPVEGALGIDFNGL